MGNEVVMDKYRDEDHGPRVEIGTLGPDHTLSEMSWVYNVMEASASDLAIPASEVTDRVMRLLEHTKPPSIFVVLTVNRIIRGFIVAEVGGTENTKHVGWLRMEVHPEYRGQGYGGLLLDEMLHQARVQGLRRLEITSYARNKRARAFFTRHGFVNEGRHIAARRDPATDTYLDTYTLAAIL